MKYVMRITQYDTEGYPVGSYVLPKYFNSREDLEKYIEKENEFMENTEEISNSILLSTVYFLEGDDCEYVTKDVDYNSEGHGFDTLTISEVDEYHE